MLKQTFLFANRQQAVATLSNEKLLCSVPSLLCFVAAYELLTPTVCDNKTLSSHFYKRIEIWNDLYHCMEHIPG